MEKYEHMVQRNKEINTQKVELACRIIRAMVEKDEKVTVTACVRRTGLSRSLFYYNPIVRDELNKAKRAQVGNVYSREEAVVLNQALLTQVRILERELKALKIQNTELRARIKKGVIV